MQHSDEEIILHLREQRRKGFELLLESYGAILFGAALRMTGGSQEAAAEIFSETLVKVWKNARNYNESKGILFTWMINMLRNQAFEYLRMKNSKNQLMQQSAEDYLSNFPSQSPAPADLSKSDLMTLLRPDQCELIDLIFFKGMNNEDAARQLKFPSGTVKTRIRAVLSNFRKFLNN